MHLFSRFQHSNLRVLRVASWSCAILLVLLSLLPSRVEIRTGAPDELEHFVAYFYAAVLFGISYPQKRFLVGGTLLVIAVFLEALQIFSPRRLARFLDAWFSGAGAVFGVVVASMIAHFSIRLSRKKQ